MAYTLLFFLVLMMAVNFMIVRPNRKAFNKRAVMLNSIRTGTIVYTADGIRAEVKEVKKDLLKLSCFPDCIILYMDLESVDRVEDYDEERARYLMDEKIRKGREALLNKRAEREKRESLEAAGKRKVCGRKNT